METIAKFGSMQILLKKPAYWVKEDACNFIFAFKDGTTILNNRVAVFYEYEKFFLVECGDSCGLNDVTKIVKDIDSLLIFPYAAVYNEDESYEDYQILCEELLTRALSL